MTMSDCLLRQGLGQRRAFSEAARLGLVLWPIARGAHRQGVHQASTVRALQPLSAKSFACSVHQARLVRHAEDAIWTRSTRPATDREHASISSSLETVRTGGPRQPPP